MSAVGQIFDAVGLKVDAGVRWGTAPACSGPGVYVVATNADASALEGLVSAPISRALVDRLLDVRPELTVDGQRTTAEALITRLRSMWLPGEPVIYIGRAGSSVRRRVAQYYATRLGARAPHAGGWPVKMLSNLDELSVFSAACADPDRCERAMLDAFSIAVPSRARANYCDPDLVLPFANLEHPDGRRKRHGIAGARTPRLVGRSRDDLSELPARSVPRPEAPWSSPVDCAASQRVTAKDILGGRIRVPADAKPLFPSSRSDIEIGLRGHRFRSRSDPRMTPRERSGVISVPRASLEELVRADERLTIERVGALVRLS